ncbi:alpha/beta fold hydrolase [Chthonobacter albigriseus]|uniref:alpha/beta fold hydrolase n=1 Tax=Chthonobacter albigriseus TaxID=1683161 RepID=UPI0015EF1601|nr:alpha/beta hydrolase [Chthonobacter albigriseus]
MDLLDLPENPIPTGTTLHRLVADDGVALRAARFPVLSGPAKGTVCLFQGRGEQIEKYFHVVEKLRARGFAVATLDWRGQGGSQRLLPHARKGHVPDFRHYERDLTAFRRQLVLPDCPPPYYGLAHSMGGTVLLEASPRLPPWMRRLVLSAPFLDFAPPLRRKPIRRLSALLCMVGLGRAMIPGATKKLAVVRDFEDNPLTSDARLFAMMMTVTGKRPDLGIGPPTNRWIHAAAKAIDRMEAAHFPGTVPLPVMIINPGQDQLVSPYANETMARRLRSCAYVYVPGARHEIMMERPIYQDQFWAAFDAFVPGSDES